jgi:hypothetical protein
MTLLRPPQPLGGNFYEPTVLIDVPSDARLLGEEVFRPVAPLIRFDTKEEAIELANASEYGLASYFYARGLGRVFRVAHAIEAGVVGVNEGIISTAEARRLKRLSAALSNLVLGVKARITESKNIWRSNMSALAGSSWARNASALYTVSIDETDLADKIGSNGSGHGGHPAVFATIT